MPLFPLPSRRSLSSSFLQPFFLLSFLSISPIFCQILTSDLVGTNEADGPKPEDLNWIGQQSKLQRTIFRSYDRKVRPVRNQSSPVTVLFHAYLMHFSVDQLQQTILLNGHLYMTWIDEMAVWDPAEFNNVRTTLAKQWEVWYPDLRIANSVSGVNQYFEISKRSHATLTSLQPNKTKVEIYPTFYMKIGCNFDSSDYPFDEQSCAARLYTTNVMSEVELSIYYSLDPSVMLGWGNQSAKRHVSDWELLSVSANLSFYRSRKYSSARPSSAFDAQSSWTLILLGVRLRRSAPLFWLALALPSVCCSLLNILSFLLPRPLHSVSLLLLNFFLHGMFIRDAIRALPPSVGDPPPIVSFAILLLPITLLCLLLHLCSRPIIQFLINQFSSQSNLPIFLRPFLSFVDIGCENGEAQEQRKDAVAEEGSSQMPKVANGGGSAVVDRRRKVVSPAVLFRLCCALLVLLISVPLLCLFVFRMGA